MRRSHLWVLSCGILGLLALSLPPSVESMCGYFRPVLVDIKSPSEILQPSQIAFITWDPENQMETVTVQPRFEGNALDFAMVIPTPSQPKLDEMPRDFFKALGVFTTPKKRAFPQSKLMPRFMMVPMAGERAAPQAMRGAGGGKEVPEERPSTVEVLEVGQVGSLDYKIVAAGRPDDLFTWLKDNKYSFAGDEATLNFYVQKKYFFTVMKIDTLQMKKNADGSYTGDVTPTRFSFKSDKLVYPTKITQVSVKDKTDAIFYVQAPFKVDLPGDLSYEYQWVSMLQQVQGGLGEGELTQTNRDWFKKAQPGSQALLQRGQELGFTFQLGQPLQPNKEGRLASTLEWAKKITAQDVEIIAGSRAYSETVPDPDEGFNAVDMRDPQKAAIISRVIDRRLQKFQQDQPRGYLTREGSKEDLKTLAILKGHVREGQFVTRFHHTFTKAEMNDDLVLVAAKVGQVDDVSEHEEVLRTLIHGRGRFGRFPPRFDLPAPGLDFVPR